MNCAMPAAPLLGLSALGLPPDSLVITCCQNPICVESQSCSAATLCKSALVTCPVVVGGLALVVGAVVVGVDELPALLNVRTPYSMTMAPPSIAPNASAVDPAAITSPSLN